MAKTTYYDVLQVSHNASQSVIEAAHKAIVERHQNGAGTDIDLNIINRAFEVLSNPEKRAGYDAALNDDIRQPIFQPDTQLVAEPARPQVDSGETTKALSMDALYKAAIGEKNTSYYLPLFKKFDTQGKKHYFGWNWPAFIFTLPWMLYRKMYLWASIFVATFTLLNIYIHPAEPSSLTYVWFMAAFFSLFANSEYHKLIKKRISQAQLAFSTEEQMQRCLQKVGGVNGWVVWVCVGVLVIGIVASIAIPYFHDNRPESSFGFKPFNGELDHPAGKSPVNWGDYTPIEEGEPPKQQKAPGLSDKDPLGLLSDSAAQNQQSQGLFDDVLEPERQPGKQGNVFDQFDSQPAAPAPSTEEQDRAAHFAKIEAAHPDFEQVVQSQAFNQWVASKTPAERDYYNGVLNRGTASQVVEMLTAFKSSQ